MHDKREDGDRDLLRDDRELLRAFREGTSRALREVFAAYADAVARFLRSRIRVQVAGQVQSFAIDGSEVELEDLLQETFVRAFAPAARQAYDGLRPCTASIAPLRVRGSRWRR